MGLEVSFKIKRDLIMKMWKFHPFLKTLAFSQLVSFRSVLLTKQFLQRNICQYVEDMFLNLVE